MTFRASLRELREPRVFAAIRLAITSANGLSPDDFRIVHFSVAASHVYLIAEARDSRSLSSGARSIAIRIARYVNDTLSRTGSFWTDRWRRRTLTTPADVRSALVQVLANFRRAAPRTRAGIDPHSSAAWFDGFREWHPAHTGTPPFTAAGVGVAVSFANGRKGGKRAERRATEHEPRAHECPVVTPRTPLLATGWRKLGLIGLNETPNEPQKSKRVRKN
jgi:hypothetical protein